VSIQQNGQQSAGNGKMAAGGSIHRSFDEGQSVHNIAIIDEQH
jgi:hypothetical protein